MFVNTNDHLVRRPIHATPEQLDIAARNVLVAGVWPLTIVASATNASETFSEKLKKAVSKRKAQQQPSRYRKPQRRERTKGE